MPQLFDMPCEEVDGRDVDAVFAATARLVAHARERKGPAFLHAVTERWAGSKPLWPDLPMGDTDIAMAWQGRIEGEHADWVKNHDPIFLHVRKLIAAGDATREEVTALDRKVSAQLAAARKFALESPLPAPETALDYVFA
jgi:TPP-dependent pyruvate/acetoin dehydrogenase alpha subunit